MATKDEMMKEIIRITPKLLRASYKKENPSYKEMRETLAFAKDELKLAFQKETAEVKG